jgi:hypothetical protein
MHNFTPDDLTAFACDDIDEPLRSAIHARIDEDSVLKKEIDYYKQAADMFEQINLSPSDFRCKKYSNG